MTRRRFGIALALAGAVGLSLVPSVGGGARPAERGPLTVLATTGMITDTAGRIGGERVRIHGLMGEGVDPHLYKASPGDIRLMTDADLILYNGLHLEGRLADVLVRLARRKPTVQVTETIPEDLLREPEEFEGHYDPHVWFDVSLWKHVAERIRDAFIELDPSGREDYVRNAAAYAAELESLHEWCREQVGRIPADRRVLVTAHDAFGYFGRAYGIEVLAIQGISTDSEASLRDVNGLVDTLVQRRIPAVFIESSVPRRAVDALVEGCGARGHAVRIGGELFSDAMGAAGTPEGTYIGMVRHNVGRIVGALGAPAGG